MSEPTRLHPNLFESSETPILREAFAKAWAVLAGQTNYAEGHPATAAMQSRLASALIAIAASGVRDPAAMALAALERCAADVSKLKALDRQIKRPAN